MLIQDINDLPPVSSIPKVIALDFETLKNMEMEGFSFAFRSGTKIIHHYIPVAHEFTDKESAKFVNIPLASALKYLKALVKGRRIIMHNAEFDLTVLAQYGIEIPDNLIEDTMWIHYDMDTERFHGLKKIMKYEYGIEDTVSYKVAKKMGFERFARYGSEDSMFTLWIWYKLYDEMKNEYPKQFELYRNVEIPFIRVLQKMNYYNNVMRLDKPLLAKYIGLMEREINYVHELLVEKLADGDRSVNFGSPKQLIKVLENKGYKIPISRKTGNKTTDADALAGMQKKQGGLILSVLLDYRQLGTNFGTFVSPLYEKLEATDDPEVWVITGYNFNGIGTRTGRLSANNPNLQNQPRDPLLLKQMFGGMLYKHKIIKKPLDYASNTILNPYINATKKPEKLDDKERAEVEKLKLTAEKIALIKKLIDECSIDIRKLFIPMPGYVFIDADYSQLELRMMAHLSGDKVMLDAYEHDRDLHVETAVGVTKLSGHHMDRQTAKTFNFKMQYGGHYTTFARDLGIPKTLAKAMCEGYDKLFAGRTEYVQKMHSIGRRAHYVQTILGRRTNVHTKGINSDSFTLRNYAENSSISHTVSGSSADIIKIAMININRKYPKALLKIQVHDELLYEVKIEEAQYYLEKIKYEMEHTIPLKVKIVAEAKIGDSWRSAH